MAPKTQMSMRCLCKERKLQINVVTETPTERLLLSLDPHQRTETSSIVRTILTTEVQWPLGSINIKAFLELHHGINERSQKMVHITHSR